jgi:hypothetical protein
VRVPALLVPGRLEDQQEVMGEPVHDMAFGRGNYVVVSLRALCYARSLATKPHPERWLHLTHL